MKNPAKGDLPHLVEVQFDPELHTREPANAQEALMWSVLDTAWNLLREYAVRITLQEARDQAHAAGEEFPDSDEQVFADSIAEHGENAPKGHLDLAVDCPAVISMLASAFDHLVQETMENAATGGQEAEARKLIDSALSADGGLDLDAVLKLIADDESPEES